MFVFNFWRKKCKQQKSTFRQIPQNQRFHPIKFVFCMLNGTLQYFLAPSSPSFKYFSDDIINNLAWTKIWHIRYYAGLGKYHWHWVRFADEEASDLVAWDYTRPNSRVVTSRILNFRHFQFFKSCPRFSLKITVSYNFSQVSFFSPITF